jgi:iron complex outermembrane receptor protein
VRFAGAGATANLKLTDTLSLKSTTDYFHLTSSFDVDVDGVPAHVLNADNELDAGQFSQEFRLTGNYTRSHWLVGIYYLKIDPSSHNTLDLLGHPLVLEKFSYAYVSPTRSWAVFSHADYELSSSVALSGGLRFGFDRKSISGATVCTPGFSGGPFPGFPFTSTCDPTFPALAGTVQALPGFAAQLDKASWSGTAKLNWTPHPHLLVYGQISRGTRVGGFNSAGGFPTQFIVFQPETLVSYEGGLTWRAPNELLTLGASLFHYHYHNFQAFTADPQGATYTFNVEARNSGAEVSLNAQPFRGFTIDLGASYLHAIEEHVPLAGGFSDQPMPFAPRLRLTSSVRYEFGWLGGKAAIQADWRHTTEKSIEAVDYPFLRVPTEDVIDAEVSWTTADERVTLATSVEDLTGAPVVADRGDLTGILGGVQTMYGPPRWVRGTVTYNF